MFENLTPGQRQMLVIGAPVVAVFALVSVLKGKNAPASTTAVPSTTGPTLVPSTDAIGVGQLSEYESLLTGQIGQLAGQIALLPGQVSQPVIVSAPAPAPLPRVNSADYPVIAPSGTQFDILGTIGAGGGFSGANVQGGAPVYANINGTWQQDWAGALPQGTILATPATFGAYIVPAALS